METGLLYFNGELLTFSGSPITFGSTGGTGGGGFGGGGGGFGGSGGEQTPQNNFGLPADVVALITARFGSVANFLRLRNLGYV